MPHTVANESCAACKTAEGKLKTEIIDAIAMRLCVDAIACAKRYRGGRSPNQYGKSLRLGILT